MKEFDVRIKEMDRYLRAHTICCGAYLLINHKDATSVPQYPSMVTGRTISARLIISFRSFSARRASRDFNWAGESKRDSSPSRGW